MKKRTLLFLLLVMALAAFLLATCAPAGSSGDSQPPYEPIPENTKVSEPSNPPAAPEKAEVLLMSWAEDDYEHWALEMLVQRFNETHPYSAVLDVVR